ncbi:MAG: hypothetical protein Kapaf2KO_18360 [Candidatus Kapaibacteriales bacterium]
MTSNEINIVYLVAATVWIGLFGFALYLGLQKKKLKRVLAKNETMLSEIKKSKGSENE